MSRLERLNESRRRRTNMRLLWISQFINTTGLMMLVPIMPLHMEQLGASPQAVGLWAGAAVAAPALPLALTTPLWGRLGDKIGRKWMVVRALVGLAIAMVLMAVAATPAMFVIARLLQGTVGGVVEAAAAFVGSDHDDDQRGSSLGRSFSATAAGALIGPIAGGFLVASDYLPFLLAGVGAAAAVLAMLCTGALKERPATSGRHSSSPGSPPSAGRIKLLGLSTLAAAFLAYLGVYGLIPIYAEHVAELVDDPATAGPWVGALHAVMWAGTLVGSARWGRRNDRTGTPLRTLATAASITAVVIVAQAITPWLPLLAPLRFAQGFAFAAIAQSVILYAGLRAPAGQQAAYIGMANSALLLGQFAGPLLAGGVVAIIPSAVAVLSTGAAVGAAAALATVAGRASTQRRGGLAWAPTGRRPPGLDVSTGRVRAPTNQTHQVGAKIVP